MFRLNRVIGLALAIWVGARGLPQQQPAAGGAEKIKPQVSESSGVRSVTPQLRRTPIRKHGWEKNWQAWEKSSFPNTGVESRRAGNALTLLPTSLLNKPKGSGGGSPRTILANDPRDFLARPVLRYVFHPVAVWGKTKVAGNFWIKVTKSGQRHPVL